MLYLKPHHRWFSSYKNNIKQIFWCFGPMTVIEVIRKKEIHSIFLLQGIIQVSHILWASVSLHFKDYQYYLQWYFLRINNIKQDRTKNGLKNSFMILIWQNDKNKQTKNPTLFVIYLANQLTLYSLSKNEHIIIIKLEPI